MHIFFDIHVYVGREISININGQPKQRSYDVYLENNMVERKEGVVHFLMMKFALPSIICCSVFDRGVAILSGPSERIE